MRQTYKSFTIIEALLPALKTLAKKHKNPINYLKTGWQEIAPDWAKIATPYLIRNNTLIMKISDASATMLQYREKELIQIIKIILGEVEEKDAIKYIKIIKS